MKHHSEHPSIARCHSRRGAAAPLVAVFSVVLFGFTALAIDIGMMIVAKSQAQNAADMVATTGARVLDGTTSNSVDAVEPAARQSVTKNEILTQSISDSQVQVEVGQFLYDRSLGKFMPRVPTTPGDKVDPESNWSMVRATVSHESQAAFSTVFGAQTFQTTASASAVHRPRDLIFILDFSGSMNYGSHVGYRNSNNPDIYLSNNPDPLIPKFGHYSDVSGMKLQQDSATTESADGKFLTATNLTARTIENQNRPPIIDGFYAGPGNINPPVAFISAGNGDTEGFVSGDRPSKRRWNTEPEYAHDLEELTQNLDADQANSSNERRLAWLANGYDLDLNGGDTTQLFGGTGSFKGYTQGPGYYGKTFFFWPPDPRGPLKAQLPTGPKDPNIADNGAKDWRQRFFLMPDGYTPLHESRRLFTEQGHFRSPRYDVTPSWGSSGSATFEYYKINYRAILKWISEGPNPFPSELRMGRILYYDAIPDWNDVDLNERFWAIRSDNQPIDDRDVQNEAFWKDYIDYTLGLSARGWTNGGQEWSIASEDQPSVRQYANYGPDIEWGSAAIQSSGPDNQPFSNFAIDETPHPFEALPDELRTDADARCWVEGEGGSRTVHDYLLAFDDRRDQPRRPRLNMWFGPLTMTCFIHDDSMTRRYDDGYSRYGKLAGTSYEAPLFALKVGIDTAISDVRRNHPNDHVGLIFFSNSRFKSPRVLLGRDYDRLQDSLWFPRKTLDSYDPNNPVSVYDSDDHEGTPRAEGGTCYSLALAMAFNQFSENPDNHSVYNVGGLGRRGAQKIVIFESDGRPNTLLKQESLTKELNENGNNTSYYSIRDQSQVQTEFGGEYKDQIQRIAEAICADESQFGFSTPRKPVQIHCLGFGEIFEPTSTRRNGPLEILQILEKIGKTQGPGTAYPDPPDKWLPDYKIVYGPDGVDEHGNIMPGGVVDKLGRAIASILQQNIKIVLIE